MPLHDGQVRYLRETTARRTKKNVLVPANRWGKSSLVACLQIWFLYHKFGMPTGNSKAWKKALYRTANVAPHSALLEPVFKTIDQIMTSSFPIRLPDGSLVSNNCQIEWFYMPDRTLNSPPFRQYFINNSYIEHRSLGQTASDSLEGKPFGMISYDEGGRSNRLQDEIDGTILARLFDMDGPLHLVSTPDQNSSSILYHHEMYEDGLAGRNQTYTQLGSLDENYFFSPAQIAKQYELYENNPLRDQVLHGKFIFGGDQLYPASDILKARDSSLDKTIPYEQGHNYIIGIDTAIGRDEMVYSVIDATEKPYRMVNGMAAKGNSKSPQLHLSDLLGLIYMYLRENNVNIMLETWNGESARFYEDLPYEIQAITQCYGAWQPSRLRSENKNREATKNTSIKKADILLALQKLLSAGELKIPRANVQLAKQLSIYKEEDANIPTDHVISLALAAWMANDRDKLIKEPQWVSVEW